MEAMEAWSVREERWEDGERGQVETWEYINGQGNMYVCSTRGQMHANERRFEPMQACAVDRSWGMCVQTRVWVKVNEPRALCEAGAVWVCLFWR